MNNVRALVLLFLPIIISGQRLDREPLDEIIKLNKHGSGMLLKCIFNYTTPIEEGQEHPDIEWFYTDKEGVETKVEEQFTRVQDEIGRSMMGYSEKDVLPGVYSCKTQDADGNEMSHSWTVYSFKVDKFEQSKTFIAGDDVTLKCQLKKNSDMDGALIFRWYKVPEEDPEAEGELLTNSTAKSGEIDPHIRIGLAKPDLSVVKIEDALYEDRSIYRCVAELTKDGEKLTSQTQILVRIKDKYSALYPFIGIVAEVVLLALIIFICEKRKSSEGTDEDDEDYHGGVSAGNGNSNLRQRRN